MREKSLAVWIKGTPRVITNSINFTMRAIKRTNVKTKSPKKNGGRTSEIKYRVRVFCLTIISMLSAGSAFVKSALTILEIGDA
jgi:hypothetical protein